MRRVGNSIHSMSAFCGSTSTPTLPRKRGKRERNGAVS